MHGVRVLFIFVIYSFDIRLKRQHSASVNERQLVVLDFSSQSS
jgi:uncharacterized membrane protein YsdA (DUF1294 family)